MKRLYKEAYAASREKVRALASALRSKKGGGSGGGGARKRLPAPAVAPSSIETDVEYENYQPVPGASMPQTLTIQRPMEEFKVKMTFQMGSVKLNEKLDPALWDLPRPEGHTEYDCP